MPFDDYYKQVMDEQFGRRRGHGYRSERDWYALSPDKRIKERMEDAKRQVALEREGLKNEKGYSNKRTWRWMGGIPDIVVYSNPELLYDPDAAKRFFKEFPQFSSKK